MRRLAALGLAAVVAVLFGLSAAPLANAHAVLVSSNPVDGARLDGAPPEVSLTFDEPVRLVPGTAQVIAADGTRADTGAAHLSQADGATIVIPLHAHLPIGSYAAMWRVISADTHVVSGSITFGVGQDAHAAPAQPVDRSRAVTAAVDAAQGVVYLGLVMCLGVTLVCATLWRWALALARVRAVVWSGWGLLLAATVAQFLLEGPRALGLGWSGLLAAGGLSETLHSRTGTTLILRAVIVLFVGGMITSIITTAEGPSRLDRRRLTIFVAGAAALAASVALLGHAAVGPDAWLAIPVTTLHLLAMAVWLGGLVSVAAAVLPTGRVDNLRPWSLIAFVSVCVLVLTGGYQAWRQVRPVEAMWSTTYGITLSIKLAAVTTMLILAYAARRRVTPGRLRHTVLAEAALGLAVITVTTVLVSQAPARSTYGPPVSVTAPLDERSAAVHLTTTRRGPTSIQVTVVDNRGTPAHADSVTGTLSSQDADIAALAVQFIPGPTGLWQSRYAVVPRAGRWTLTLTVEFSSSQAIVTAAHFRVW